MTFSNAGQLQLWAAQHGLQLPDNAARAAFTALEECTNEVKILATLHSLSVPMPVFDDDDLEPYDKNCDQHVPGLSAEAGTAVGPAIRRYGEEPGTHERREMGRINEDAIRMLEDLHY